MPYAMSNQTLLSTNGASFSQKAKRPHVVGVCCQRKPLTVWLREKDLNLRPLGYEPNELPDCSISRYIPIVAYSAAESGLSSV